MPGKIIELPKFAPNLLRHKKRFMIDKILFLKTIYTPAIPKEPNLALLFEDTNRLTEAESLMRNSLAIWEKNLGAEHPKVALALNNLAQLLRATNRLVLHPT